MSTQPLRKPAAVLFDFGDTVVHTVSWDPLAGDARILDLAENRNGVTAEQVQQLADEIGSEVMARKNESMIEFGCQSFQRFLFEMLGLRFSIDASELEQEFWRAAVTHQAAEGIRELLHSLDRLGITTGIVSNNAFSGKILEDELAAHGLLGHFKFVISSMDYGFRKPHRRIFDLAVKKLGLDASDVWFAGDKVEYDVVGARGAGLVPVWYNYSDENNPQCDCLMVRTWGDFKRIIESL